MELPLVEGLTINAPQFVQKMEQWLSVKGPWAELCGLDGKA
jgi:hypothetical protein